VQLKSIYKKYFTHKLLYFWRHLLICNKAEDYISSNHLLANHAQKEFISALIEILINA